MATIPNRSFWSRWGSPVTTNSWAVVGLVLALALLGGGLTVEEIYDYRRGRRSLRGVMVFLAIVWAIAIASGVMLMSALHG